MTTKPRWKSRIRWNDGRATHEGHHYLLWAHGYEDGTSSSGEPIYSRHDAWHLHEVLANNTPDQRPMSNALSRNQRQAARLAELWILGWRPAPGYRFAEHGYREMWRALDKALHPIADVLSGAVPH